MLKIKTSLFPNAFRILDLQLYQDFDFRPFQFETKTNIYNSDQFWKGNFGNDWVFMYSMSFTNFNTNLKYAHDSIPFKTSCIVIQRLCNDEMWIFGNSKCLPSVLHSTTKFPENVILFIYSNETLKFIDYNPNINLELFVKNNAQMLSFIFQKIKSNIQIIKEQQCDNNPNQMVDIYLPKHNLGSNSKAYLIQSLVNTRILLADLNGNLLNVTLKNKSRKLGTKRLKGSPIEINMDISYQSLVQKTKRHTFLHPFSYYIVRNDLVISKL